MQTPPTPAELSNFQKTVLNYYKVHQRSLPWRKFTSAGGVDPYHVFVSELMLQQTQVSRVVPKFQAFMGLFPTVQDLASAPLAEVLTAWAGLGYNRRAKYLHDSARAIVLNHAGIVPQNLEELVALPGVGKNTAAAILAYSFNMPVVFIETNIRAVYIHHFFPNREQVADSELLPILEATLDGTNARQWYWALMDYGTHLKATVPNPSARSKHHVRQSTFEGSRRQVRGSVLKLLAVPQTKAKLAQNIHDERLTSVLQDLVDEQLISIHRGRYHLGR